MTRRTILGIAAVGAMAPGAALAQLPVPSMSLESDKKKTPEEIEHDKAVDKAYRAATQKIPDQQLANDPWASVRPAPHTATTKKKQVSQKPAE